MGWVPIEAPPWTSFIQLFSNLHYSWRGSHFGANSQQEPRIGQRGQLRGLGLGTRHWPVGRANAWLLENNRLALHYDRFGFIAEGRLQAACMLLVAPRPTREF